jgi:hypothetical protein
MFLFVFSILPSDTLALIFLKIQVVWLITSPVGSDYSSISPYNLPNIRFNLSPNNRVSSAIINRGINVSRRVVVSIPCMIIFDLILHQLLASNFIGQRTARHLIVVAASSPSEAQADSTSDISEWNEIAQKLKEVTFSLRFHGEVQTSLRRSEYSCISS